MLTGKIIQKKAGSFTVASNNRKTVIANIPKTHYDFFNLGDTIKCRVFHNTHSNPPGRHLSLYEIDPDFFQTAKDKRIKQMLNMSLL